MTVSTPAEIGALIRDERIRQRLTQTDLAGLAGVGITFISQLENGKESAELGKVLGVLTILGIDLIAERRA
ncbi:type II toxin-antitoxin system Y4mF family antitoxin [Enorma sp.]|jgi:HTH-type transcriptional regulator/antitoxin HipB|uniref:type II toxin-antitoxin system Y4mF family antitoxin n=1 Tax=Enorma sp. TaxID=1920692 RepID=UPI0025C54191|nr:type II toxin-antitoxin system Y4mF family antitoxin [Enorma sp.]